MVLLERIVPAIRETRVPLIAGYIWLLVFWLTASEYTSIIERTGTKDTSLWRSTLALDTFNQFGFGVAVSVAAFMTGSMIGYVWNQVLRPL